MRGVQMQMNKFLKTLSLGLLVTGLTVAMISCGSPATKNHVEDVTMVEVYGDYSDAYSHAALNAWSDEQVHAVLAVVEKNYAEGRYDGHYSANERAILNQEIATGSSVVYVNILDDLLHEAVLQGSDSEVHATLVADLSPEVADIVVAGLPTYLESVKDVKDEYAYSYAALDVWGGEQVHAVLAVVEKNYAEGRYDGLYSADERTVLNQEIATGSSLVYVDILDDLLHEAVLQGSDSDVYAALAKSLSPELVDTVKAGLPTYLESVKDVKDEYAYSYAALGAWSGEQVRAVLAIVEKNYAKGRYDGLYSADERAIMNQEIATGSSSVYVNILHDLLHKAVLQGSDSDVYAALAKSLSPEVAGVVATGLPTYLASVKAIEGEYTYS
jgi:ethanolamine utilization microcompartment shell protein EutS